MFGKNLLTIPEFCRDHGVSRSFAYKLLRNGDLKAVKVGRLTRIRAEDAADWAHQLAPYKPRAD